MTLAAIGCAVLQGDNDVFEIGRKLGTRDGAQGTQIFVRGEMLLRCEKCIHCRQQKYRCTESALHFDLLLLRLRISNGRKISPVLLRRVTDRRTRDIQRNARLEAVTKRELHTAGSGKG